MGGAATEGVIEKAKYHRLPLDQAIKIVQGDLRRHR